NFVHFLFSFSELPAGKPGRRLNRAPATHILWILHRSPRGISEGATRVFTPVCSFSMSALRQIFFFCNGFSAFRFFLCAFTFLLSFLSFLSCSSQFEYSCICLSKFSVS